MTNPLEEAARKIQSRLERPAPDGVKGSAERDLDQNVASLENQRIALSIAGELCADPRWQKLMEWAAEDRERKMQELLAAAGDPAKAARLAGAIEVLDRLRVREAHLQKLDQALQRRIADLQERRVEAQYMDTFGF